MSGRGSYLAIYATMVLRTVFLHEAEKLELKILLFSVYKKLRFGLEKLICVFFISLVSLVKKRT